jgi:hypothetical protein
MVASKQGFDYGGLNGKRRKSFLEKVKDIIQENALMPSLVEILVKA